MSSRLPYILCIDPHPTNQVSSCSRQEDPLLPSVAPSRLSDDSLFNSKPPRVTPSDDRKLSMILGITDLRLKLRLKPFYTAVRTSPAPVTNLSGNPPCSPPSLTTERIPEPLARRILLASWHNFSYIIGPLSLWAQAGFANPHVRIQQTKFKSHQK